MHQKQRQNSVDHATLRYYAENARSVAARYESVASKLAASFHGAFNPNSKILDIGCGSGRDLVSLSALGHDCYGVDGTAEFVELAQEVHPELAGRITHAVLPDCELPFSGEFDAVLCSAVLMHLPIDQLAPSAIFIKRCLKAGGRLLYSVPSKRLDVDETERDEHGRLFVMDSEERLQGIFEEIGFVLVNKWSDSDSLGRGSVEWLSVLMELREA
jgi:SAM-dependent methyltransferase